MADEIVLCRRKDDHTQTLPVAVSALPYFPDWEPVPTTDDAGGGQEQPSPPEGDAPKSAPAKPVRKAAESKGRGE